MALTQERLCNGGKRLILLCLSVVCIIFVAIQYRFNFTSTTKCFEDERSMERPHFKMLLGDRISPRYIKRLVERVYYEVPVTKKDLVPAAAGNQLTESSPRKELPLPTTVKPQQTIEACAPERHIMFLKTHKTGSSTITNLLNRYADKFNLSILLPLGPGYYSFDWPNKFRLSSALPVYSGRPNFLANHARYSRKSLGLLFPRESTKYISILRHPVSQWESTFQYMSFSYVLSIMSMEDPMSFFLDNLPTTENIAEVARRYPSAYLIRNPLFFDLGLDYSDYENSTMIRRAVNSLDRDFDLVLIMEHFDESLTLLRRRLCWDIDDVVYFKMNERLSKHKRRVLSEDQIKKIKRWNNADMVLYNYFVEKFWREIHKEGEDFYDDVLALRERRNYYADLCIEREAVEEAYSSVYVKGYKMRANLTSKDAVFCERMLRNELRYQDYFRTKHTVWLNNLEGVTIENFKDSSDEAEIYVDAAKVAYSTYEYGSEAAARRQASAKGTQDVISRQRTKSLSRNYAPVESTVSVKALETKSNGTAVAEDEKFVEESPDDELVSIYTTSSGSAVTTEESALSEKAVTISKEPFVKSSPRTTLPDDTKRFDGKTIMQRIGEAHT